MWTQTIDPFGNLIISTIVAALPIIVLAALLLSRKVSGTFASLCALGTMLLVSVFAYHMPVELAGLSALYGMTTGLVPIGWIVLNAVFLYNISIENGSFSVVRDSIESVTPDRRLQALLIAFCFGAFLEGAAGFGAPVAITAGMLVGLGFDSLYAASICLLANTAPVAFGGIGIAVITAGHIAGIDPNVLSRMIGHQLPFIALVIPLWLILIVAGWRGAREIWPAILVTGGSYALMMFISASYFGPTLPDILSSVFSLLCLITLLRFWRPAHVWRFPHEKEATIREVPKHSLIDLLRAWTPYLLLIVFISNWALPGTQSILGKTSVIFAFGPLDKAISVGTKVLSVSYTFPWLAAAGTAILFAAFTTAILQHMSLRAVGKVWVDTLRELRSPLITIASVVGFAYVANYSGMSSTLAAALSKTGFIFPFLAPFLGWLGVFLTGSDTSSNALFSGVQSQTATSLGINPVLTVASNSSGGVAAKMISPQSIAVAAASTKLTGREGELFRRTILHSIGIVTIIGMLAFLQAYVLPGMVPEYVPLTNASVAAFGALETLFLVASIAIIVVLAILNSGAKKHGKRHHEQSIAE